MAVFDKGYLKIDSKEERQAIAQMLFNNGYTVFPARVKKNEKQNYYLVGYELRDQTVKEEDTEE